MNSKGIPFGFTAKSVFLNAPGSSITLGKPVLYSGATARQPLEGLSFAAGTAPKVSFEVVSTFAASQTLTPVIRVYKRTTGTPVISEVKQASVVVASKGKKSVSLTLPTFSAPESYLAEVLLLDASGNPASNNLYFRWVIAGQSAKVLTVAPLLAGQPSSQFCGVLPLKVTYVGSADGVSNTANLTLSVAVMDTVGKSVGQATKTV